MGKVTILSSLGEGLYRVKVEFENARVASRLLLIGDQLTKINTELITLTAARSAAQSAFNEDISALNFYIDSTDPEIYTSDPSTLNELTAATYESRIAYDSAKQKESVAKLRKTNLEKDKNYLENYCPDDIEINSWCVVYNEDLTGVTGSFENDYFIKFPHGTTAIQNETGVWLPAEITAPDSQLQHPLATSQHANWFNSCMVPPAQRHKGRYRIATIDNIDYGADTCSLTYDGQFNIFEHDAKIMPDLPIIPQMPNTLTQSNTVDGANITYLTCNALSFIAGDRVIVDLHNGVGNPSVIGFVSNPRRCKLPYMAGRNNAGNLGMVDFEDRLTFELNTGNYHTVSFGSSHTGLLIKKTLYMTGAQVNGGLGLGPITGVTSAINVPVFLDGDYKSVSCGAGHSLYLTSIGDIYGSGLNQSGQIGNGSRDSLNHFYPEFVASGYKAIFSGWWSSFGINDNDDLFVWGENGGILGIETPYVNSPEFSGSKYKKVASSYNHTLALKINGDLMVTGSNSDGQIGRGSDATTQYNFILLDTDYKDIAAGQFRSLAVKNNGDLYIFGYFRISGLGISVNIPTKIGTGFKAVWANQNDSYALTNDGKLYGMGWNIHGELGLNDTIPRISFVLIGEGYTSLPDNSSCGYSACAFK